MGYDLHITRAEHWLDGELQPILLEEWKRYVAQDPEFELVESAIAVVEGEGTLEYPNDGLAVGHAFSGHDPSGNQAWFNYQQGYIVVKNPTDEIIRKMKQVAEHLAARVIGDDGESY